MSYTAVPTAATGDVWTASNHNLYIRDNFRATVPDVVTTKGDLIIGDGADALVRGGVSSDGSHLFGVTFWESKYTLFQPTAADVYKDVSDCGEGNIHVPTDMAGVPEGASWVYGQIRVLGGAVSTAYVAIYPAADTTFEIMRCDALSDTNYNYIHGFWPLNSTGGMEYFASDSFAVARIYVYAWMY